MKFNAHQSAGKASEVFGNTELLERILLRVNDLKTLLLAQRVCREWRNIINTNNKLQKKLYFMPAEDFEEVMSLGMVGAETLVCGYNMAGPYEDREISVLNTLLITHDGHQDGVSDEAFEMKLSHQILPETISARRGKSSWERMYLCQPADEGSYRVDVYANDKILDEETQEKGSDGVWEPGYYSLVDQLGNKSLRKMMDKAEEDILEVCEGLIAWKDALLSPQFGALITSYKKLEESIDRAAAKASEVFGITELLEHVLLDVDNFKTVLLAQRVSTKWRDVIKTNDKLQKKLFFKPATLEEAKELCMGRDCSRFLVSRKIGNRGRVGGVCAVMNSLVTNDIDGSTCSCSFKISAKVAQDRDYGSTGASSWERMYFSQPPCDAALEVCIPEYAESDDEVHDPRYREMNNQHSNAFVKYKGGWEPQSYSLGKLGDKPLGAILDAVEELYEPEDMASVDWEEMDLSPDGWCKWCPDRGLPWCP